MEVSSALSSKPDDIKNNFTSNSLRVDFGPIVIDLTALFISVIATSMCDTKINGYDGLRAWLSLQAGGHAGGQHDGE